MAGAREQAYRLRSELPRQPLAIAKRMEAAIRNEQIKSGDDVVKLSCCFGVASTEGHQPPIGSISELVELADAALYQAKRQAG